MGVLMRMKSFVAMVFIINKLSDLARGYVSTEEEREVRKQDEGNQS
jgi:hypothetical protein